MQNVFTTIACPSCVNRAHPNLFCDRCFGSRRIQLVERHAPRGPIEGLLWSLNAKLRAFVWKHRQQHKQHRLEVTGKDILWFMGKVLLTAVAMGAFLIGWLSL